MRRKFLAEFIGSALLLATVVGSGIMGEHLAGGNVAIALLGNTLPTGAMLVVLITILGPISGAHFNPAVTVAMAVTNHAEASGIVPYAVVQIAGAVVGVWLAHLMFDLPMLQVSEKMRWGTGQWIAEAVAMFGLLLTIYGGLRHNAASIPMLVGLYITAAYWFTASTSFANPAVTLARALTNTFAGIAPSGVLPFITAQAVGAGVAIAVARILFPAKEQR